MSQARAATHDQGLPPHDLEAERAVIGACLVSKQALVRVVSELEPKDFYSEDHRLIFSAIKGAARENEEVDSLLVRQHLPKGKTEAYVMQLIESVPTASNATRYSAIVLSASRARVALDIAERVKQTCLLGSPDEYAQAPQRAIAALENLLRRHHSGGAAPISEALEDLAGWLDEIRKNEGVTGLRTGIGKLDLALKGLNKGRLYIVAGRPGSKKSLLCGQIGLSVARQKKRVLLQSTEMRKEQYMRRLAVASAGVDATRVEEGSISNEESSRIFREGAKMNDLPFFIADVGTQTVADVRRNVIRYEPDLLIVDYLQRLMPDDRRASRYEQVSQISFDIDRIKNDFEIPVLSAAQLSRAVEQRQNKRPMLSDLRDSGTVEQDADAVAMLYNPAMYEDDAPEDVLEISLEKNRHGSLFEANLHVEPGMWITDKRMVS